MFLDMPQEVEDHFLREGNTSCTLWPLGDCKIASPCSTGVLSHLARELGGARTPLPYSSRRHWSVPSRGPPFTFYDDPIHCDAIIKAKTVDGLLDFVAEQRR